MANYTVTTLSDSGDDATAVGTLAEETADGGGLSLREAISLAEGSGDFLNAVGFANDLSGVLRLQQGALVVQGSIIDINGNGQITISGDANGDDVLEAGSNITDVVASRDANRLSDNSRLFEESFPDLTFLELSNLTLTGGYARTGGGYGSGNGGVASVYAYVSFDQVIAAGNGANGSGGAVSTNTFDATDSIIRDNHVFDGGSGGAISGGNAFVRLTNTSVSDNVVHGNGNGAGIASSGYVFLTSSTIANNLIDGSGEGGGISTFDDARLTNSTIANNRITGSNSEGAGISADTAVRLYNSTVTGNVASGDGSRAGGIYTSAFLPQFGLRGIDLVNSIVSGNAAEGSSDTESELAISFGSSLSNLRLSGGNIVGNTLSSDGTALARVDGTDVFAVTQSVNGVTSGVLQANGGPVATVALTTAGAAVNAGDRNLTTQGSDARGESRVSDGEVDLGAFELQAVSDPSQSLPPSDQPNEISTGDGDDRVTGAQISDLILTGAGNDRVRGGDGDDEISGGAGNDALSGDAGIDTLLGGEGNDRLIVSDAGDVVIELEGEGYDRVIASISYDLGDHIEAGNLLGADDLSMTTASTGSWLNGNTGNNSLIGLGGRDRLDGNAGDDVLDGRGDNDVLEGGSGSDRFVFALDHAIDLILDFEVNLDVLDFRQTALSFVDLNIVNVGSNAIIISDEGLILLRNVAADQLTEDQFLLDG